MFGIDVVTVANHVNDWAKQYWGLLFIVFVADYCLTSAMRCVKDALWKTRARRMLFRPSYTGNAFTRRQPAARRFVGIRPQQRTLAETLDGASDTELAKNLTPERFERLNELQPYMRGGQ